MGRARDRRRILSVTCPSYGQRLELGLPRRNARDTQLGATVGAQLFTTPGSGSQKGITHPRS